MGNIRPVDMILPPRCLQYCAFPGIINGGSGHALSNGLSSCSKRLPTDSSRHRQTGGCSWSSAGHAPPAECLSVCCLGMHAGGIITSVLDCHGNWTAAIALMDRYCSACVALDCWQRHTRARPDAACGKHSCVSQDSTAWQAIFCFALCLPVLQSLLVKASPYLDFLTAHHIQGGEAVHGK